MQDGHVPISDTAPHGENDQPKSPTSTHTGDAPTSSAPSSVHGGEEVDSPEGESDQEGEWSNGSESDDQDESTSDQDEDEEDEDIEPSLKYERLAGNTSQLLEKDSACALVISSTSVVSARIFSLRQSFKIIAPSCSERTTALCTFSILMVFSRNHIGHIPQQLPT